MAGKDTVSAIVKQASEEQMLEWALIENIHREDLNPLERANAYHNYINNFSMTQQEAAVKLGEDRSTIANYIRLLELPSELKNMLREEKLSMGHARALLGVANAKQQIQLAMIVVNKNLSVRELERRIQKIRGAEEKPVRDVIKKTNNVLELEREMTRSVGTKVTINAKGKRGEKGRIIIEYYSYDDFDRIKGILL